MTEIVPLVGWDAIAKVTPYKPDTLRKLYLAALVKAGVVIYRKVGRPPRRRPHAYPQELVKFFS
jgi:hypothetical protein